jgi:TonB family protein
VRCCVLFLALLATLIECGRPAVATIDEAVKLNNQGVHAINDDDFELAAEKFKKALRSAPDYMLARNNLEIAYNNAGLKYSRTSPERSLKYFHQAILVNPFDKSPRQNLDEMLIKLGREPNSFDDRVMLGSQAEAEGDYKSAVVEYWFALRYQKDEVLARKLEVLCRNIRKDEPYLVDLSVTSIKNAEHLSISPTKVLQTNEIDKKFAPYMSKLQLRIKEHWHPPNVETSYRVSVLFKVSRGGDVLYVSIFSSSGLPESDVAAIEAVKKSSPLSPPPISDNETDVDIKFTFDYNYFSHQSTLKEIEVTKLWRGLRANSLPIIRL